MDRILLVGCGGFIGAVLRYLVSVGTLRLLGTPLYGTLVVNVVGCLLIGFLGGLAEERQYLGPQVRLFLFVGLLGGFTTFSSVAYETAHHTPRRSGASRLSPHWPATVAGDSRGIRRLLGGPLAD